MVQVTGERIARRVKRIFGDESGVQVTNADVIDWLNDAMTEATVQNGSINLQRRFAPAIKGVSYITLPNSGENFAGIHSISYRSDAQTSFMPLTFVSNHKFEELFPDWQASASTGCPSFYTNDVSGKVRVYPAPSTTDGRGFSILYNSFFCEVETLTEVMDISPRYFQYLLEYCLMKAYEMDENWEAADRKATFIQSTLNVLHSSDTDMHQSTYPVVSDNVEDM